MYCQYLLQVTSFFELNKHTTELQIETYLKPLMSGNDVGVISEAGCPGIADPGSEAVRIAHEKKIQVVPLVGPSSILLALISSGFNGQKFAFNGYLNKDKSGRQKEILHLERLAIGGLTQLFIETPYRNNHLLDNILTTCSAETKRCIATDITLESEFIKTKSVKEWIKGVPNLHKRPTIFLVHKY